MHRLQVFYCSFILSNHPATRLKAAINGSIITRSMGYDLLHDIYKL